MRSNASAWVVGGAVVMFAVASASAVDDSLVDAVRSGNSAALRSLLRNTDVNRPQPDGTTALHWAALLDDLAAADLLLGAGAKVDVADDYGVTPLSLASTNGSAAMIERLLKAGANPNAALPGGETPLMTAARTGRADAVQILLAKKADVTARETEKGQTALMWAAAEGHKDVIGLLIAHGAGVHERSKAGFTPLLFAARNGDIDTARALLTAGARVNDVATDGTSPLLVATIRGHLELAEMLLTGGADPNAGPGFTPLHWAAGRWDSEFTDATTGITGANTEWSSLGGLRGQHKIDFVKTLLDHGADPNARAATNPRYQGGGRGGNLAGGTPFLMAAKAGDAHTMRVLLARGADPSLMTNRKTTTLMAAAGLASGQGSEIATAGALDAVRLAFETGAEVNAINADGDTALHGAASTGWDAAVQFLVDAGARLNVKNSRKWTALTVAEGVYDILGAANFNQYPSTAALLRKFGAEPSPPDIQRDATALDIER